VERGLFVLRSTLGSINKEGEEKKVLSERIAEMKRQMYKNRRKDLPFMKS